MDNTRIILLDVPDWFYKQDYFEVSPEELRVFLENMVGYVHYCREICMGEIDIETTIRMHMGDCRIWYKNGTKFSDYIVLDSKQLIMRTNHIGEDETIFDWLKRHIPSLYKKHMEYGQHR